MEKAVSIINYIQVIVKWRKLVVCNVLIVTLVVAILSLFLIQKFTATATILPPNSEQETMLGLISANIPSGLAGLARMGGGLSGFATPSDLFAAIMKSGRIRGAIINKYDLRKEFRTKTVTDAAKLLDKITNIEVSPEGIISVSVTYKNKFLAADIANSYIKELDTFNNETAMTVGKRYRMFIEQRLKETEDSLTTAEEQLRYFQEKHRTISLNAEVQSIIETIAKLKSEIILREVQRGTAASGSSINNPYVQNIEQELREFRRQLAKIEFGTKDTTKKEFGAGFAIPLSNLPEVSLEYARILRDVKVQEAVYELLTQQYEQAKIMELKDTPTVQFLDKASPPEKRSFPHRAKIVLVAFVFSLFLGILLAFVFEYVEKMKKRKENEQWLYLIRVVKNDLKTLQNKIKGLKIFKRANVDVNNHK